MQKQHPTGVESTQGFHPDLSRSHYRALMRVENKEARSTSSKTLMPWSSLNTYSTRATNVFSPVVTSSNFRPRKSCADCLPSHGQHGLVTIGTGCLGVPTQGERASINRNAPGYGCRFCRQGKLTAKRPGNGGWWPVRACLPSGRNFVPM